MAIDTREKRASAAGAVLPFMLGVTPNAAKDGEWRQQAAWGYSGIAVTGAPAAAAMSPAPFIKRRRQQRRAR